MIREGNPLIPSVVEDMGNPSWSRARGRILIVRLSRWKDICQSSSHVFLFGEARRARPHAFIDFAFLPPQDERKRLSRSGEPWFSGRISGASPQDFDLILVSNAFALELINFPYLFSTAGLPLEARDRSELTRSPLVVAGGSNASAMGALLRLPREPGFPAEDSFVDGIFFGEGEDRVGELVSSLLEGIESGGGRLDPGLRRANLETASKIEGFWPCLLASGPRRVLAAGRPRNDVAPLVLNSPAASAARLAITSGCPGYCSFCLEGWDRSPYAEGEVERLASEASGLRKSTGASDLELFSFNFNTHASIGELIFRLNKVFATVSFMSQRLDILARSRGLFELEMAAGKRNFTLGIEGISARMRRYYRKGLEPSDLETCMDLVSRPGVSQVKLFYIISGLETEDDMKEFSSFLESAAQRRGRSAFKLLVSAGFLVRLPFTPLQFAPLEFDALRLNRIADAMREACGQWNAEFRLAASAEESFVDQALSLLGDLCRPWLAALPSLGFVYEADLKPAAWKSLHASMSGEEREGHLRWAGEKDMDFRPPLAFIQPESRHRALWKHYLEAKAEKDRPSCLGAACTGCAACSDTVQVTAMTRHPGPKPQSESSLALCSALLASKARFQPCHVAIELGPGLVGSVSAYRASYILRMLSRHRPGIESSVFEARELYAPDLENWYGWCVYSLIGPVPRRLGTMVEGLPWCRVLGTQPRPSALDIELSLGKWEPARLESARKIFETWSAESGRGCTSRKTTQGWLFSQGEKAGADSKPGSDPSLIRRDEILILQLPSIQGQRLKSLASRLEKSLGEGTVARVRGWDGMDYGSSGTIASH